MNNSKRIGVFATGSPARPELLSSGISMLEKLGFEIEMPFDPSERYGDYTFGFACESVKKRAEAFQQLLDSSNFDCLLAVRGAYGTSEILPQLQLSHKSKTKKVIVGFSDVTALLAASQEVESCFPVHGPSVTKGFAQYESSTEAKRSVDSLLPILRGEPWSSRETVATLRGGSAEGLVLAGNLTMFTSLLGTPWDPNYEDKVLFLEETGEKPYRVHRALVQLQQAGKFEKLRGLVFGSMGGDAVAHGPTVDDVVNDSVKTIFRSYSFPICRGYPFGHGDLNLALPYRGLAKISADSIEIKLS